MIRYCDGQWALYDPGIPGDSTAIYQSNGTTWSLRLHIPNTMCRSDYVSIGVPAGLIDQLTLTC